MPLSAGQTSVPLTWTQRLRLTVGALPLVAFTVMIGGYLTTVQLGIIPPAPVLFYAFIALVMLVVGYQAVQALRDLLAGAALVDEDILVRAWRTSGPSNDCYAKFERLGTLRVSAQALPSFAQRLRYRIAYSPASKIAWTIEPVDLYWRKHEQSVDP